MCIQFTRGQVVLVYKIQVWFQFEGGICEIFEVLRCEFYLRKYGKRKMEERVHETYKMYDNSAMARHTETFHVQYSRVNNGITERQRHQQII